MSIDALRWAWTVQGIKSSEKLVLLSLSDRSGEDHTCFPSIKRLCMDTCLERKTVISVLSRLSDRKLISFTGEYVGRTKQVKKYRLIGVQGREELVPKTEQFQKRNSSENGTGTSSENGTLKQSQKRDTEPKGINPNSNPNSNPKNSYIDDLYNYWQSKGIQVHKRNVFHSDITKALKVYSLEEVKKAIDTYSEVYHREDCYFSHKWTLGEFLSRDKGLKVFFEKDVADYISKGYKTPTVSKSANHERDSQYNGLF